MTLVVLKFGGTSVGDASAMRQVAQLVRDARTQWDHVVVVTSAMGKPGVIHTPSDNVKVTDTLLNSARKAADGDAHAYQRARRELADKHQAAIDGVVSNAEDRRAISEDIERLLAGFEMLCASVRVLGEVTPRALDAVAGLGERMAARILAGALRSAGISSQAFDSTDFVVTNNNYQSAVPLMELTRERVRSKILPVLQIGIVPVITGFIGATEAGVPTTLGRGGSDYSGSIIGAALDATEVHNFTDVNGVLSTDPRIAPDAHTIDQLSSTEMSELAFFGASVLHPMTIAPLVEQAIPLRVKNTFNARHPGTLIVYDNSKVDDFRAPDKPIKAVTIIEQVSMVTVSGRGMRGVVGIAGRTFTTVARTGTSVYMFTQASSEQNICMMVPQLASETIKIALLGEFERELRNQEIDAVQVVDDVAIITAVGLGISRRPGVSGKIFGALGDQNINILAIAQGSSECGLSLVVSGGHGRDAVRALHTLA